METRGESIPTHEAVAKLRFFPLGPTDSETEKFESEKHESELNGASGVQ